MSYFNDFRSYSDDHAGDLSDQFYAQSRGPECDSCDDDGAWARTQYGTAGCPDCGAGDETDNWADRVPEDAAMESSLFGDC